MFAVGGMTAEAILAAFTPNASAHQIAADDKRVRAEHVKFPSPKGHTDTGGYLARPANATGKLPGVIVIHGAAGLESHFEDVARCRARQFRGGRAGCHIAPWRARRLAL